MIKMMINRKPVLGPWGGGNLYLKAMCDLLPSLGYEIVHELQPGIDIIFIINPRYDELGVSINEAIKYKSLYPDTKIIQRINDCDDRKNTKDVDTMLVSCSQFLDKTIFVSEWMKKYFLDKGWHCKDNSILINGCEELNFNIEKFNNNKINIVTHHWSNNYLKGFDIYDSLDTWVESRDDFTFTYIGRERGTFKNTKVIKPLHGMDLLRELSKYDIYISGSRCDPGPNHILESIRCSIPTYVHKNGGGCVEFAGTEMSYKNIDNLFEILLKKNYVKNKFTPYTWSKCISLLDKTLRGL